MLSFKDIGSKGYFSAKKGGFWVQNPPEERSQKNLGRKNIKNEFSTIKLLKIQIFSKVQQLLKQVRLAMVPRDSQQRPQLYEQLTTRFKILVRIRGRRCMKIHLFELCWCYDPNSFCVSLPLSCRFQKYIIYRGVSKG